MKAGHLGPTIFRSEDLGKSWSEAGTPPAFPKAAQGAEAESVSHVFWLSPGHASQRLLGGNRAAGVKVLLPTPLAAYTANAREVEARGTTLAELFSDLDRQFPGLRFRVIDEEDAIRPHIKVFVNRRQAASIAAALAPSDEVLLVAALSGG